MVSRDALRAGKRLANAERIIAPASQTRNPSQEKTDANGTERNTMPTPSLNSLLTGTASTAPSSQLSAPMVSHSVMTSCRKDPSDAPISRVLSITFMLIVPANPKPPTNAMSPASISIKVIKISIPNAC